MIGNPRISAINALAVLLVTSFLALAGAPEQAPDPPLPPGFRAEVRADFLAGEGVQHFRRCFPYFARVEAGTVSSQVEVAANIFLVPIPCRERIAFQIVLEGRGWASSIRSADEVHLITRECANLWASQQLFLDSNAICAGGLGLLTPIHSELLQVTTGRGPANDLLGSLVESGFDNRRERDDRKITAAIEDRLLQAAFRERACRLRDANKHYEDDFLSRLWDAGLSRQELHFSSDPEALRLSAKLENQQLPAPPPLPAGPAAVQLHPAFINELANRSMAGKTYTDKQMDDAFSDLNKVFELPPLPKVQDVPWSITMADKDPLIVRIEGNTLITTLRGKSYTSDDNRYNGMNVTSRYHIVHNGGDLRLVRDEELEVLPPDFKPGLRIGVRQEVLRSLLRRRFGRLLPKEIPFRELKLDDSLQLQGAVRIKDFLTTEGWLTIAVGYQPGATCATRLPASKSE